MPRCWWPTISGRNWRRCRPPWRRRCRPRRCGWARSCSTTTFGNPGLGIAFAEQMRIIRETAGPRYAQLELSVLSIPRVTDQADEVLAGLAVQMHTSAEVVRDMPATLVGSLAAIEEKLLRNRAE